MSRLLNFEIGILLEKNMKELKEFELENLKFKCEQGQYESPIEAEMSAWTAPWRPESLEYYLPKGWSFSIRDLQSKHLQGYFLAQPLLFFQQQTQSLWVEYLTYISQSALECLIEVATKHAKEKHLQRVYFSNITNDPSVIQALGGVSKVKKWNDEIYFVQTTKG